jgi:hypothetical protein
MHNGQYVPSNCVRTEEMTEKPSNVSESVGLIPMDGVVIFGESLFKLIGPKAIDSGKTFANQAIKLGIRSFLRTALNDHRWKFGFLTGWKRDFHQLVDTFLGVYAGHNCQIYRSPKVDEISVGLILDLQRCLFFFLFIFLAVISVILVIFLVPTSFP